MLTSYQEKNGKDATSVYINGFSYWKAFLLGFFIALFSFLSGYFIDGLVNKSFTGIYAYIGVLSSVVLFLSFFVLNVMFVGKKTFLLIALSVGSVAMAAGFFRHLDKGIIIGGAVSIVLFCVAGIAGKREMDNFLKINFFKISREIMSKAIFSLGIFLAIVFFGILSKEPLSSDNIILSQKAFDSVSGATSKILGPVTGGVDLSMSLEEIVSMSIDGALKQQGAGFVDPSIKKEFSNKLIRDYQDKIQSIFGERIDPTKKVSIAMYDLLLNKFNSLKGANRTGILALVAVLVFLAIQSISPILRLVAGAVAFLIYEFLMLIGFGGVVYESQSKETIILS